MTGPLVPVAGFCPMGCGPETLILVPPNGVIMCIKKGCPGPHAVAQILADQESEHVVSFRAREFAIRHPLRERLGDALLDCGLLELIQNTDRQDLPYGGGRWRAFWRPSDGNRGTVTWEKL